MVQRLYLRHCFSSLTRSHRQLHHCYFDPWTFAVSSWTAGSPSSQSSSRIWAGVWHWESAGHSCSLSTKTSMWHLRVLPDERRGPPQAGTALAFKMCPWGPCSERGHLRLRHWGSLHLFFLPHLCSRVCPRLLISITLSPLSRGTSPCCMLLILLLTAHPRLVSSTCLIMLRVYCAQQGNCKSCFI